MSDRNYCKWSKFNLPMFGLLVLLFKNYIRIADYIVALDWFDDISSLAILVIFALSVIRKKYNISQLVIIVMISALAFYTGMVTDYMILTTTVLTMIAIVDEDIDRIIWFMFCVTGLLLIFNMLYMIVLSILGFAGLGGFTEGGTRYGLHFGYGMAGHLADCILNMMLMWTWNHYKKY